MMDDEVLLSLTGVAELAGVTKAAVGNWRRRHRDFPAPVRTSGAAALFGRSPIEQWLRAHGKQVVDQSLNQRLWSLLDVVRGTMEPATALQLGMEVVAGERVNDKVAGRGDAHHLDHFLRQVAKQADEHGPDTVFEALLGLLVNSTGKAGSFMTPETLAHLVVQLAGEIPDVVYDPASGAGEMLTTVREQAGHQVTLLGHEINSDMAHIANMRMRVHGFEAQIVHGNAFTDGTFRHREFELVLANPPFAMKWQTDQELDPGRLPLGLPPRNSLDLAWPQLLLGQLSRTGRVFMVVAPGALFRTGAEGRIREELIRQDYVEAVIGLPPGLYRSTGISCAILILRHPAAAPHDRVLMVDASDLGQRSRGQTELDQTVIDGLTHVYHHWHQHAEVLGGSIPACSVAATKLLETHGELTPRRWVVPTSDPQATFEAVTKAEARFKQAARELAETPSVEAADHLTVVDAGPQRVRLGDLVDGKLIAVFRGGRVEAAATTEHDLALIRPEDIKSGWLKPPSATLEPREHDEKTELTKPGDVLVGHITEQLQAAVDHEGGHAVAGAITVLRCQSELIDPTTLAALLNASWNRRFLRGTVIPHGLMDVELPLAPLTQTRVLSTPLSRLDGYRRAIREAAAAADALFTAVVDGVGSGTLQPIHKP